MPTRGNDVAFAIRGPITPADLPGLCERVRGLLGGTGSVAHCDVAGVEPDAVCVDALARLQLAARRRGCCVRLENASQDLLDLVGLMGLTHVLPADGPSRSVSRAPRCGKGLLVAGSRQLYVNLCVGDLERSVAFFSALGFSFEPRFTDETATCMIVGENAYVMLLTKAKFEEFTRKPIVDATAQTEVLLAISAGSREGVDELADAALASGGAEAADPLDHGVMYSRSFQDPDGHVWEVVWMDEAAADQKAAAHEAAQR
jgi:predicted lactoylglutathione lyase/ABC-type transporter Mla MlaB component